MSTAGETEEEGAKTPRSRSPAMGVSALNRDHSSKGPNGDEGRRGSSPAGPATGILRLDPAKPRRSSAASVEFKTDKDDPSSPCPSDRLSVTWADGERSVSSDGVSLPPLRVAIGNSSVSPDQPSITTLIPACGSLLEEPLQEDPEDDYSASVSAILKRSSTKSSRRSSKKKKKMRRTSTLTTSSGSTVVDMDGSSVEDVEETLRVHKEVLAGVKQQPWPISRKLRLARTARDYIKKHEGEHEQRLAESTSTKDVILRYFILFRRVVRVGLHTVYQWVMGLELWQNRIKTIESHFGSAVASYFTFLRWVLGLNVALTALLAAFVIIPEFLAADRVNAGERKTILEEDQFVAYDFKVLWDFEGILRYSPLFYGYYSKIKATREGYRLPLAYFLTSLAAYGYSFIAILRKMAANSRMSKLSEDEECTFSWRLLAGWDFTIGNMEAAQNKVAAINTGFRETLLEAKESEKEEENWKLKGRRFLAHLIVLALIVASAYAVVLLVQRSEGVDASSSSWFRQNELTITLTLISLIYPNFFELVGLLELRHPRNQLQWQLARIMALNLLNLYTLIFALFSKVDDMTCELKDLKDNLTLSHGGESATFPMDSAVHSMSTSFENSTDSPGWLSNGTDFLMFNDTKTFLSDLTNISLSDLLTTASRTLPTVSPDPPSITGEAWQPYNLTSDLMSSVTTILLAAFTGSGLSPGKIDSASSLNSRCQRIRVPCLLSSTVPVTGIPTDLVSERTNDIMFPIVSIEGNETDYFDNVENVTIPLSPAENKTSPSAERMTTLIAETMTSPTEESETSLGAENITSFTTPPVSSEMMNISMSPDYVMLLNDTDNNINDNSSMYDNYGDNIFPLFDETEVLNSTEGEESNETLLSTLMNATTQIPIINPKDQSLNNLLNSLPGIPGQFGPVSLDVLGVPREEYEKEIYRRRLATDKAEEIIRNISKREVPRENGSNDSFSYMQENINDQHYENLTLLESAATNRSNTNKISSTLKIVRNRSVGDQISGLSNSTENRQNSGSIVGPNVASSPSIANNKLNHLSHYEGLLWPTTLDQETVETTLSHPMSTDNVPSDFTKQVDDLKVFHETEPNSSVTMITSKDDTSKTNILKCYINICDGKSNITTTKGTNASSTPRCYSRQVSCQLQQPTSASNIRQDNSQQKELHRDKQRIYSNKSLSNFGSEDDELSLLMKTSLAIDRMNLSGSDSLKNYKDNNVESSQIDPSIADTDAVQTISKNFNYVNKTPGMLMSDMDEIHGSSKDEESQQEQGIRLKPRLKRVVPSDDYDGLSPEDILHSPVLYTDDSDGIIRANYPSVSDSSPEGSKPIHNETVNEMNGGDYTEKFVHEKERLKTTTMSPGWVLPTSDREAYWDNLIREVGKMENYEIPSADNVDDDSRISTESNDVSLNNKTIDAEERNFSRISPTPMETYNYTVDEDGCFITVCNKSDETEQSTTTTTTTTTTTATTTTATTTTTPTSMSTTTTTMAQPTSENETLSVTQTEEFSSSITTTTEFPMTTAVISETSSFLVQPMKNNPEKFAEHLPTKERKRLRKLCWETMFGQEIIKLTVMDMVVTVVTIVIGDYIRAVVVRLFNGRWCCWDLEKQFPGYPDFKIAENILHLVNNQGMIWMGMFFAPGLAVINTFKLVVLLYVRSWAVVTSNVPPEIVFKASNNNNFYLFFLLTMLFLCTLPVGYAVVWLEPSWHCGPFSDYPKMYQLATSTLIGGLPSRLYPVIDYISSPGVIIPAGLLLILIIYYLLSLTAALREANSDLRDQLRQERSAEKRKAMDARSGKGRAETPTTRWGRVVPLTPMPRNRLHGTSDPEKSSIGKKSGMLSPDIDIAQVPPPLADPPKGKDDGPWPDDVTDLGHSEVFDDSLSEPRKMSKESPVKPKGDKHVDVSLAKQETKRKEKDRTKSHEREREHESLPKSPHSRPKHRHNSHSQVVRPEDEMGAAARMQRGRQKMPGNQSKSTRMSQERKQSDESSHRESPTRIKSGSLRQSIADSPMDKKKKVNQIHPSKVKDVVPEKGYEELNEVLQQKEPRSEKIPKIIAKVEPQKIKEPEVPKAPTQSRHRREPSILKMDDLRRNSQGKSSPTKSGSDKSHHRSSSEDSQGMQTIPVIKISKEDSVERSLQQAKLERQQKTQEEDPDTASEQQSASTTETPSLSLTEKKSSTPELEMSPVGNTRKNETADDREQAMSPPTETDLDDPYSFGESADPTQTSDTIALLSKESENFFKEPLKDKTEESPGTQSSDDEATLLDNN